MEQTPVEFLIEELTILGFNLDSCKNEIDEAKKKEKKLTGYSEEDLNKAFKKGYALGLGKFKIKKT
jgi:hypothetical protein